MDRAFDKSKTQRPVFHNMAQMVAIFFAYFVAAKLGLLLATVNQNVSPIWPATGVAFAALLAFGVRVWPAIFFGALVTNLNLGSSLGWAMVIAGGNTLEAWLGWWIFNRTKNFFPGFELYNEGLSVVAASVISPIGAALSGSLSLIGGGVIPSESGIFAFLTWWSGDLLGGLIFTPILLNVFRRQREEVERIWEWGPLLGLGGAVSWHLFFGQNRFSSEVFLLFPLLLLLQVRCGVLGNQSLLLVMSAFGIWGTSVGQGVFSGGTLQERLTSLQLILASLGVASVFFARIKSGIGFRLTYGVLVIGCILGGATLTYFNREEIKGDQIRFEHLVSEVSEAIKLRTKSYEDAVKGGAALFAASKSVEREEWDAFVDSLSLPSNFPGINGLGFVKMVKDQELDLFLKETRADGAPEFKLKSLSNSTNHPSEFFIIKYINPLNANRQALGLDLGSESLRREAAEKARDLAAPIMTRSIKLVQDSKQRPGFLLYFPVYKKGIPNNSIEERRKAIEGWVYSPFILEKILDGVSGVLGNQVLFEVWESDFKSGSPLLSKVKDPKAQQRVERLINLWGQNLVLRWFEGPEFNARHDTTGAWICFSTVFVILLFTAFVNTLQNAYQRANELAEARMEQIRANQAKLVESSKMASLGEMAGGVAHEINNPLAIIAGRAGQILRALNEKSVDVEKIRTSAEKIEATVGRIAKIVKGLKSFARSSEKDPMESVALENIVSSTLEFCEERFKHHGIQLRMGRVPSLRIRGREAQLAQVFLNLLNNAHDAIEGLAEKWIEIHFEEKKDLLQMAVIDSGNGIPEEVAQKVMQPFFTTKPVGKGTGLGLSISKGIIEEHGGTLSLDPNAKNTTFVIILPVETSKTKQDIQTAA